VLKPVAEGSSVGVFIVTEEHRHPPQELTRADWKHGEFMLAERYIPGMELTCAVMGDEALDVIEIEAATKFYDYEAKYAPGGSRHILPARIKPNIYQKAQILALKAHRALGCRGISRADFRFDNREDGSSELFCLEVNTQPGMTETSLVPELAAYRGMSFGGLVKWIVEDASLNR
jgi:D-alanine-D-alanine ligase